ncbi:ABC transporter substrate-binding protein [Ignatzschineria larvae DSM 13226]|uniref:ABC transporter substrate-binding protein n=1 Tax=Ignatzschineria larvae DSM 13226 TaxID=1111732 RepID=A0ABZ3C1P5_9GAMM|nr:ABC transporter substrate-binding protein [Ignatzschineria larvae]
MKIIKRIKLRKQLTFMKCYPLLFQGFLSLIVLISMLALAGRGEIDLSIEQLDRPRVAENSTYIRHVSSASFVKPDYFTVGLSTSSSLPLHDYASDAMTIIGFDVDLALAIADSMGKELNIVSVAWADWPLGLSSGKFDAIISNITVTEERKKKYDFATYRKDNVGIYVKHDSSIESINKPSDIAGLRIITDSGTNQEKILLEWDQHNIRAGLAPVKISYYDDRALQTLAVESGRADAIFSVNPMQAYAAAISGKTKHVGTVNGGWPLTAEIAVAFPKGSDLVEPTADIINELINNGIYHQILTRWALESEAIEQSLVNPQGLP